MSNITVTASVKRELVVLKERDEAVATGVDAATALALAKQLDSAKVSATAKAQCAARLGDTMDRLYAAAPQERERDVVDEVTARREKRRAAVARATATADPSGP